MSLRSHNGVIHHGAVNLHRRAGVESRYFVLKKDRILYYKTQQDFSKDPEHRNNRGCIALSDYQGLEDKGDTIILHLRSLDLELSTDEQATLAHWIELLQRTVRTLQGHTEQEEEVGDGGEDSQGAEDDVPRMEQQNEEAVKVGVAAPQSTEDEAVEAARPWPPKQMQQPPILPPPGHSGRAGPISMDFPHVPKVAINGAPPVNDDNAMWDEFEEVSIPTRPAVASAQIQSLNPQPPVMVASSSASSFSFAPPHRGVSKPAKTSGSDSGMTLYKVFAACNKNSNGRIDKKQLIRVCKFRKDIAVFFGLPLSKLQPGGESNAVEHFFAKMDVTNEAAISWQELKAWYGRVTRKKPQPQQIEHHPFSHQASLSPSPRQNNTAPTRSHSVESMQRQPSREPATRLFPTRTLSQTAVSVPSRGCAAPQAGRRLLFGHTSSPPPQAAPIATLPTDAKTQRRFLERASPTPMVAPSASTCSTSYEPSPRHNLVPRCAASIPERHRSPEPRRRASYFAERAHTREQANSKEKAFLSGLQYPEILHGEDAIVATSRRRHSISHKVNYPRLVLSDSDFGATEKITGAHEARAVSPTRRSCPWQKIVHVDGQMPTAVSRGRHAEPPVTGKITAARGSVDPHAGPQNARTLSGKVAPQR